MLPLREDAQVRFSKASRLTPEDLLAGRQHARARVLCWFAHVGHLGLADARDVAHRRHDGSFPLAAWARIEGDARPGMERPLRYCARGVLAASAPFAVEAVA